MYGESHSIWGELKLSELQLLTRDHISSKWVRNLNSDMPDFEPWDLWQIPGVFQSGVKQECLTESVLTKSINECRLSEHVQKIRSSTSKSKVCHLWFGAIPIGVLQPPVHGLPFPTLTQI